TCQPSRASFPASPPAPPVRSNRRPGGSDSSRSTRSSASEAKACSASRKSDRSGTTGIGGTSVLGADLQEAELAHLLGLAVREVGAAGHRVVDRFFEADPVAAGAPVRPPDFDHAAVLPL